MVPETQCGFRSNRSTVDMILFLLQEKCIEQDRPLYIVFVDITKAFDTVGRTGLWQLLRKYGCPEKLTTMIESLHTGMMVNARNGGEVSDTFAVTNGVKQGCVLAPTLFSICISAMLEEALRDMGDGVYIQSRQNAHLFTVAHFRAKTKTTNILVRELLFCRRQRTDFPPSRGLLMHLPMHHQSLASNIKKTEAMFQPNYTTTIEKYINVDETTLNPVQEFTSLGSTIARDGHTEAELQKRMSKASMSFGRLRERLWNNHNVSIRVKSTERSYCPP